MRHIPKILDVLIPLSLLFLVVVYITKYKYPWYGIVAVISGSLINFLRISYESYTKKMKENEPDFIVKIGWMIISYCGLITFLQVIKTHLFTIGILQMLVCIFIFFFLEIVGAVFGEKLACYSLLEKEEEK